MHGSRSKAPSEKSLPYVYNIKFLALLGAPYIYDIKFLALLGAPYIYDISKLRVKVFKFCLLNVFKKEYGI
jgi:hypothetical protein